MAETQYQKRMKVRRMSDIERLAREYSKNVESMTGQYQQSYAAYQKDVAAKMAPYETAVEQYKIDMGKYDKQRKAYKNKLNAYRRTLQYIEDNPTENIEIPVFTEEAPVAPSVPTRPEIAPFDQSTFEVKSKELGQTYQREVGERKSARLGAVARRMARPMLQEG